MDVYGSQTEDDVADRGRCHTNARTHIKKLFHCRSSCSHTDCRLWPGSYLNPKVLVSPPQQGVHILQHQLGGVVQKVKVQVETQQRRGVHLLARRGGGGGGREEAAVVD